MYTSVIQYGNALLVRERDKNGVEKRWRERNFKPQVFIPSKKGEFVDIRGETKLAPMEDGGTIADLREFLEMYSSGAGTSLYGMDDFALQYIQSQYDRHETIDKSRIRIHFIDIEVFSDEGFPRPELANKEVNAITIYDTFTKKYHTWALCDWDPEKSELSKEVTDNVIFKSFKTEKALLLDFLSWWEQNYPDIVTGWNSDGFDIHYLYNRFVNVFDEDTAKKLSPWGLVRKRHFKKFGRDQDEVIITGINQNDYLKMYRKFVLKMQEAYTLDHIMFVELKERKLSYEEAGSLHALYKTNPQKFIDYNIKDVYGVVRIDQKRRLLSLIIDMAYFAGVNFSDTMGPVKMWEAKIYDYLKAQNKIIPWKSQKNEVEDDFDSDEEDDELEGAIVCPPPVGKIHRWMCSFDLTSLYPHIIMQWNLGPDTAVIPQNEILHPLYRQAGLSLEIPKLIVTEEQRQALKDEEICMAGNGTFYRRTPKSFLSDLMWDLFNQRKAAKDKSIEAKKQKTQLKEGSPEWKMQDDIVNEMYIREQALKVLLNSAYGALGNNYFMFYSIELAEAVTLSGQCAIKWIEGKIDKYLQNLFKMPNKKFVQYFDTDSAYVDCEEFVKRFIPEGTPENDIVDFLDGVCKKIREDAIDPGYEELREYLNCPAQMMIMKREAIASAAVWRAKKRYVMRVLDSEGVREEDYKVTGLEAVSTRTPTMWRSILKDAYKIILTKENDHLIEFIEGFRSKLSTYSIEDLASGTSVSGLKDYSDSAGNPISGTPYNTKAALLYNRFIREKGIDNIYPAIQEGEKIKIVDLVPRNPLKGPTKIAFQKYFPKEFGLNEYIDRKAMFESGFVKPLRNLTETFGWKVENSADLSDFFA